MSKFFVVLLLGLSFLVVLPAKAGCPQDVTYGYEVKNLTCEGECDNLFLRASFAENPHFYYFQNTNNCTICDVLSMNETNLDEGVLISGMELLTGGGRTRVYKNGQLFSGFVKHNKEGEFPKSTYEISYNNHRFSFNLESKNGLAVVKNLTCLDGCKGIKIVGDGLQTVRYDGCSNVGKLCSASTFSQQANCGGGYSIFFDNFLDGIVPLHDPAFRVTHSFNKEDLRDVMSLSTNIGKNTFKYDLVKDENYIKKIEVQNQKEYGTKLPDDNEYESRLGLPEILDDYPFEVVFVILAEIVFVVLGVLLIIYIIKRKKL